MSITIRTADFQPIANAIMAVDVKDGKSKETSVSNRGARWNCYLTAMPVMYAQVDFTKPNGAALFRDTLLDMGSNLKGDAAKSYATSVKRLVEGSLYLVKQAMIHDPAVVESLKSGDVKSLGEKLASATFGHRTGFEKPADIQKALKAPVTAADKMFDAMDRTVLAAVKAAEKAGDTSTLSAIKARLPEWTEDFLKVAANVKAAEIVEDEEIEVTYEDMKQAA